MSPGAEGASAAAAALRDALRERASRSAWSRGVELARAGRVALAERDDERVLVHVLEAGSALSAEVSLWPDDEDFACTCPSEAEACAHAVAAAIALATGQLDAPDAPSSDARQGPAASPPPRAYAPRRLVYRVLVFERALGVERLAVGAEGAAEPLRAPLEALARGRVEGAPVVAGEADLDIERALEGLFGAPIPRGRMLRALEALSGAAELCFDGRRLRASTKPVLPRVVVTDDAGGFLARLAPPEGLERVFPNGAALVEGVLRPIAETPLDAAEREALVRGRRVPLERAAWLASEWLPGLSRRLPLELVTERLPRGERLPLDLALDARREGEALVLCAWLVYGDPPRARVGEQGLVDLQGALPLRDRDAERRLAERLARQTGLVPGVPVRVEGEEAARTVAGLGAIAAKASDPAALRHFREEPALSPALTLEGGRLGLSLTNARGGRADAEAALAAWRGGASLVPLEGGGYAPLPESWLAEHGALVGDLLAARDARGELSPALAPELARLADALGHEPDAATRERAGLIAALENPPPAPLPEDFGATPRDYQRRGIAWLVALRRAGVGGLLADDMGLGKTLQAIAALEAPALVVAPTSVLGNWRRELARFRPALRVALYHGPERRLDEEAEVTLTSYAILRLDADALAARSFASLVLDEAQAIKNPESATARAARRLVAPFRLALTGTPVENRLEDLWSIMRIAEPGLLGSLEDFRERYERPIAAGEEAPAARLRARLAPFLLRRRKDEVARELPPRIERVLTCSLDEEERAVYDALRAAARDEVAEALGAGRGAFEALEALLRLRQAACHAGLVPGVERERSSKVELVAERLAAAASEGHRALVFSQWTSLLDRVEPALEKRSLDFVRLDGATRDREGVIAAFADPGGPPVMLISLKAGGTGLNLAAADHVFLLDPWWNPAVEEQAADRAHRIGQDRPVFVHRVVAEDTVEERVLGLAESKRALAEAALGGAASRVTREEILALLD